MNEPTIQLSNNGNASATALLIAREIAMRHFQGLPHERQDPSAQAELIAKISGQLIESVKDLRRIEVSRHEPPDSQPGCNEPPGSECGFGEGFPKK